MRNTRPARVLIVGVGIAVAAVTLAACGSGSVAGAADSADSVTNSSAPGETGNPDAAADQGAGLATGQAAGQGGVEQVGSQQDPRDVAAQVAGKVYGLTKSSGLTFVDPSLVSIAFPSADQISVNAGCNQLFGQIEWSNGLLTVPTLASTMMACPEELMAQDTALGKLFAAGFTAGSPGETLTLTQGDVVLELSKVGDVATDPAGPNDGIGDMEQPIPTPGETPAHPGTDQPDTAGAGSNDGIGPMETLSPAPGETPAYQGD